MIDLLRFLDRSRYEVLLVCPPDSQIRGLVDPLGIRVIEAPLASLHLRGRAARVRALIALVRIVRAVRPDVIHVNQAGIVRIAAVAGKLARVPVVTHVRLQEDAVLLRERVSRWLIPDVCVAISESIRSALGEVRSAERAHRTRLIPLKRELPAEHPVQLVYDPLYFGRDEAAQRSSTRIGLRRSLNIPDDAAVVSLVGRICEEKGQDVLVEAAHRLGDQVYFLVVGGDAPHRGTGQSYADRVRSRAKSLGLAGRVIFTGMRTDVPALMAASDVVVLASQNEPFGRVLLEALTVGVPVIAASAGGAVEIVGNDQRGLTFPPGDAPALARRIVETLSDPEAARARTARGAEWVRARCSPVLHARSMERIYDTLAVKRA